MCSKIPPKFPLVLLLFVFHLGPIRGEESHSNSNGNRIIKRGGGSSGRNVLGSSNFTAVILNVDSACVNYCVDQIQYNGVCMRAGCGKWKSALRDGCISTCNDVENYRENYACAIGCSRAVEDYYSQVTGLLGSVLDPPSLILGSVSSNSLRLNWEGLPGAGALPYISYSVQRRVTNSRGLWEALASPTNQTQINVVNLKPYTQYQFRVGYILATELEPYFSRESNPILTEPKGLPSAPDVTSIQPISSSSVAISWTPPPQPNGRLVAYILKLEKEPHGPAIIKEIPIPLGPVTGGRGYTFSGLVPDTNYTLALSAQNLEGEGDSVNVKFATPPSSISNEVSQSPEAKLLVAGAKHVYFQPLDLLMGHEAPIYSAGPGLNITGFAVYVKRGYAFISTSDGAVRRLNLSSAGSSNSISNSTPASIILQSDRLELDVVALSVDWLHNRLYIVGKKSGSLGSSRRGSSGWIVKRCDLQGNSLTTVLTTLSARPLYFEADPFTGFLYWVEPPSRTYGRGGLFKLDLDLIADPFLAESPRGELILEGRELGPFTLDVQNYRVLIIDKERNTVYAVSLEGETIDIRPNTQSPQWHDAISLALYNNVLFWTTPSSILSEEYNAGSGSYYQNSFSIQRSLQPLVSSGLAAFHPSVQPVPVPKAPPSQLQVLYGQRKARISWRPPPPISAIGVGAWCEWSYQIRVSDNRSFNVSSTEFTLKGLQPSTPYSVHVAAFSEGGRGPFSSLNRGKTLRETSYNITLLWGSANGALYATDTLGEELHLVTNAPEWTVGPWGQSGKGGLYMSSLTWYESVVMFALNNGSIFYYVERDEIGSTSKPLKSTELPNSGVSYIKGISYAQSIAYDYIGHRLYWSNPREQTIYRCGLGLAGNVIGGPMNCASIERLQLVTMAKEIAVDSYRGYILWTTGHSIEMSRMNGHAHGVLFQNGMFSGKQIMGIALDTDQPRIYWITLSASGSTLKYMRYTIRSPQQPLILATYEDTVISGPIRYFNDRLLWLQSQSEAVVVITDINAHEKSSLKLSTLIANVTNVHVRDQGALRYPGGLPKSGVQVSPKEVPCWSLGIAGHHNNFTLSWNPVNNTNYGKVVYEVSVDNVLTRVTEYTNLTLSPSLFSNSSTSLTFKPHSFISISITAMTYWASSNASICRKRTPDWKPTAPRNPRAYVKPPQPFPYNPKIRAVPNPSVYEADLRWDAPLEGNGVLLGYLIKCWKVQGPGQGKKEACHCEEVDMVRLSCALKRLAPNSVYEVEVQGYTSAGPGTWSEKIMLDTGIMEEIPRLLITTGGKMELLDVDRGELESINLGYLSPISATFLGLDQTLYWFNEGQDLMKAKINSPGYNKSRILSLSGKWEASHLVGDWVGRKLYWAVEPVARQSSKGSNYNNDLYGIMTFDLSVLDDEEHFVRGDKAEAKMVLYSKTAIKSLAFNPFRNALYWSTGKRSGGGSLYTLSPSPDLDLDPKANNSSLLVAASLPRPFLSRSETCNCSTIPPLSSEATLAFDPTGHRSLLFSTEGGGIWAGDENGCSCTRLVTNTNGSIFSLAGDLRQVYWSGGRGYVAAKKKFEGTSAASDLVGAGVREIKSFGGPTVQPFPPTECLLPQRMEPEKPLLFNHSSHSLHLNLPVGLISQNCSLQGHSLPTPHYSVYYGTVEENLISKCTPSSPSHCKIVRTLESSLHINDLHPYTTYTVFVTLSNYYAIQASLPPLSCSPIMLRTAPGAPMPPKILRVEPLGPTRLRVVWGQPEKLNGEKVWYEVNWSLGGGGGSSAAKWAESESRSNSARTELDLELLELRPGRNYSVWVRAFSEKGDAFTDSERRAVATFQAPNNLTLAEDPSPHKLILRWEPPNDTTILRHQIIYREGSTPIWTEGPYISFTIPGRPYTLPLQNLKPKTLYLFRLRTWYIGDPSTPFLYPPGGETWGFETKADKPSAPGKPIARGIGKNLYEVEWTVADENGGKIELYSLETKSTYQTAISSGNESGTTISGEKHVVKREIKSGAPVGIRREWVTVYNGTEPRWVVEKLDLKSYYNFRVRAKNVYGWGAYSNESESVSLADLTMIAEPQSVGVIIGSILLSTIILGLFAVLFVLVYRRNRNEKPHLGSPAPRERSTHELATLRELPSGVQQNNILYSSADLTFDLDLVGIPKIKTSQILDKKFLAEGAFGSVWEAIAINVGPGREEIRVAIKMLKKGANHKEKLELVEEAKLQARFRHPNITKLVGICVDADPCYLILELMAGGDLLSYLRRNRPHQRSPSNNNNCPLSLVDLLKMCVDVAKGCVYLEEKHYVHRDIAARNCLVNYIEHEQTRVVKIGDFGLTRDIYRNDYYRKDGEGLLPVRWMAPEALIDGIFTVNTDVWAFGVLLWEIMTLGQQPYPARSNLDVWNYVRGGGRPQRPQHCPHILGNLMLQCWEYAPHNRPSFKDCLNQLESICGEFEASLADGSGLASFPPLTDVHFDPYSYSEGSGGIHQGPFFLEEGDIRRIPNYLEVLSEEDSSLPYTEHGYEIPLPKRPPRSSKTRPQPPSSASTAEVGLPSPSYWNAETLPHRGQYRNLLSSSTSEDADGEEEPQQSTSRQEQVDDVCCDENHHYVSNPHVGGAGGGRRLSHLRGVPCRQFSTGQTATAFNNHSYAAQHLNQHFPGGQGTC